MTRAADLSVVIPTRDTRSLVAACLRSLRRSCRSVLELVVVDDGSRDGTADSIAAHHPEVRVNREDEPLGFSGAVNRGAASTSGDVLLVLNSDTEVDAEALDALLAAFAARPGLGIAGAQLRYPDGRPQWSGGPRPTVSWLLALSSGIAVLVARIPGWRRLRAPSGVSAGPVDWVTGAAMAVRREVWEAVGPFDEGYRFYCQDLALCTAARAAGWEVAVVPGFTVMHHHGASISSREGATAVAHPELLWTDLVRYFRVHEGEASARRCARVLRLGTVLRLAVRGVAGWFVPASRREAWRRESAAYRRALAALHAAARS